MKCPRCQHENRAGAKFCEQCATALARFCVNCGGPLPDAAKFCPACAHIYGAMALATEQADARAEALKQAEELLRHDCVSHCHLWFYRDAMDATLAAGEWDAALHFANALEAYVREEPLPWATLFAARTRALVAAGRDGLDASTAVELQRLREEARRAHLDSALPAIDAALARA